MDNKLSELSKPVDISNWKMDSWREAPCNGTEWAKGYFEGWNKYHSKVEEHAHLYSQEYVSALLADNEYMRWRIKEIDLLFGKNLLAMRAAIIEAEHGEGHTAGMQWIFNTLFGPGEFAPENETDAQDYYNREVEKIDVEFSKCMDFFQSRHKSMKEQSNG